MATIDNLSIQLNANAEAAIAAINRTASSAERLRGAAQGAAGGMQSAAQGAQDMGSSTAQAGEQTEKTRKSLHGFWNALKQSGSYMGGAFLGGMKGIVGALGSMASGLLRIAKFRIYRTIVKDLGQSFKDLYGWSKMFGSEYANSMDRINSSFVYLRNSIASAVAPLFNALAPVLDAIIDKIVTLLNWLNQLFSALSGASTYTVAKKVEQSWVGASSKAASNAKKASDEIKRTILGFDEINKLSKESSDSSSGGSGGGGGSSPYTSGYQYMFEEKELAGGWKNFATAIENAMSDAFSRITMIVGGAELALGAILALSGANIPLGIALMASGAVAIASAIVANWDGISDTIKKVIGVIEGVLAGGLAVGAILAFSGGNVPLGIGLMAAALATGFGSVDILWTTMKDKVGGAVGAVVGIVSAAMIGVGAVLAFSGVNPGLGIGLIAAGVTGVAATLDWEFITDALDTPVKKVIAIVGGASLAIGAILLFSGVAPGVGVAMVAAGATATAATINWNFIKEKLQGPIGQVTALVSGASLVLGILALMGGVVPLGIGLILAGAAGLVSTVAANWDGLVNLGKTAIEKVKEGWETIKELVVKGVVSLVKKVGEWASDAWDLIQSGAQTIAKKVTAAFEAIGEWTGNAWLAIQKGAETIAKKVTAAFEAIGEWAGNVWLSVQKGAEVIAKKVTGAFEAIGEWTGNAWLAIQKGAETIAKKVTAAFEAIGEWAGNVWLSVQKGAEVIAKKVTGAFEAIGEWTGNAWIAIQKGAETIEKKVTAGMEVLQSWADNIVNFILGPDAAEKKANIALALENIALAILNFLRDPLTATKNIILSLGLKFAKGVEKFWNWITGQDEQLEVQVDAYGNIMMVPKAGEGLTDNGDGTFSMTNDVEGTTVLSPVKSPQWEQAWKELFGNTPESEVKLNVVKGKIESGVESIVENAGKTIPTTINAALTKASTWVSDAWTAMTKGDHSSKTTQRLVKGAGANWSANAWTAMTKGDHSSKTTQRLVKGAGANWSENAWTALNANGTHDNTTNQKLKKGSWSDSGYTAMTTTGSHSNTTTQDLKKGDSWSDSAYTAMTKVDHKATITVNLKKGANDTIEIKAESGGGSGGGTWKMSIKKLGGIFSNGVWKGIPQYADGVLGAMHGSMFLAGEAGPELVGHVGGRTEVLNQSQLAATMFSAVRAAMGGVRISATMYDGGSNAEDDYEMMYRAMYDAFTDAMAPNNARDQEKMQLMREIAAKEFTAEVTANSINRAQQRMNRRAGTTIVPVTT